jgi:hypothetical protein
MRGLEKVNRPQYFLQCLLGSIMVGTGLSDVLRPQCRIEHIRSDFLDECLLLL